MIKSYKNVNIFNCEYPARRTNKKLILFYPTKLIYQIARNLFNISGWLEGSIKLICSYSMDRIYKFNIVFI